MSRRRTATLGAALLVVLAVLVLLPRSVSAATEARLEARDAALRMIGAPLRDPAGDATVVAGTWDAAGAAPHAAIAAAMARAPAERATALIAALCGPSPQQPAPHPAAGDLIQYADSVAGPGGVEWRVGIFISGAEVVIGDGSRRVITAVQMQRLVGDSRAGVRPDLTVGAVPAVVCRIDPAIVPGADAAPAPGAISLVDPQTAAQRLHWAADHPRDGDTSMLHPLWAPVERGARAIGGALLSVIAAGLGVAARLAAALGGGVGRLLDAAAERLGWRVWLIAPLADLIVVRRFLGSSVDLRGLHTALVAATATVLSIVAWPEAIAVAALAWVGRATGWWSIGDPGSLGRLVTWNVATFLVDTLTGIDGTHSTPLLSIAVAVVGDVLIVAKPLLGLRALARLAPLAGRLAIVSRGAVVGRTLNWAGTFSDVVSGKLGTLASLGMRGGGGVQTMTDARIGLALATRTGDLAGGALMSGGSSAVSTAVSAGLKGLGFAGEHAADFSGSQSSVLRSVAILARLDDPARERVLAAALPWLRSAGGLGQLSHLHSGATSLSALANGVTPPLPHSPLSTASPPRSPVPGIDELTAAATTSALGTAAPIAPGGG